MVVRIDSNSEVPPRRQVRAAIVQRIASGTLAAGAALPSVREMAERAGIAPMTVTRVYADLKRSGLVEARTGAGTFVSESPLSRLGRAGPDAPLWRSIDGLIADAAGAGIAPDELISLLMARDRAAGPVARVVLVGLFGEATRSYAARVAAQTGVPVAALALLDEAPGDADLGARLAAADLIVTFATLRARLARLAPGRDVVTLRFIPAEATRLALAAVDPLARLVAVSRFPDFLPILTMGIRRFASHVPDVASTRLDAPDLPDLLAGADVVVMSTGAESAAAFAPAATAIAYLHVPDPGDVDRLVVPRLGPATLDAGKEAS